MATPESTFAPLPLRPRGPMEVLDIAVRVFKQYLWVLLGWSALVVVGTSVLSFLPGLGIAAVIFTPIIVGACACCLAAAVRGQPVSFGQCWQFTKSRFGPMLGMYLLALLIMFGIFLALIIVGGLLVWGIVAVSSGNSSAGLVGGVVIGSVGGVGALLLFSCLIIWISFVMIVVCMEEDKRGTPSLRRAYDLLRGHWGRILGLSTLLGLGMLALLVIFWAAGAMLFGVAALGDLFSGRVFDDSRLLGALSIFGIGYIALQIVWSPLFYLTLTLFYLDLRIRKEALDLEWSAHTTTPEIDGRELAAPAPQWTGATDATNTFAPPISANAMNQGSTVEFDRTPSATLPPTQSPAPDAWYDSLPETTSAPLPPTIAAPPVALAPRTICHHCGASVSASPDANGIAHCTNCGQALPATPPAPF